MCTWYACVYVSFDEEYSIQTRKTVFEEMVPFAEKLRMYGVGEV